MDLDVFVRLPLKLCVRAVSRLRGRFWEFEQYACLQREAAVFSQPSTFHHSERNNDFSSKHPQDVDLSSTHPARPQSLSLLPVNTRAAMYYRVWSLFSVKYTYSVQR